MQAEPPPLGPSSRLGALLSLGSLVVFALLLIPGLGSREFWTDEVVTAGHVVALNNTYDAFHPRAYYLLLYEWKQVFGASDLALRAFSLPWAFLAWFLLLRLSRLVVPAPQALLGQWLFVLSPFVVLYFRMARFYSLVTAAALLVAYAALLVLQQGRWRHWLLLGFSCLGLLTISYSASVLLAPLMLLCAWRAWQRRQLLRLPVSALPYLPFLVYLCLHLPATAQRISTIEAAGHANLLRNLAVMLGFPVYSLLVGETTDPWRIYLTLPALLVGLVGLVRGIKQGGTSRAEGWPLVVWAWPLAVIVVSLVVSFVARSEPLNSTARSAIFAAPLAYLVLAAGLMTLQRRGLRALALALLLVADGYGLANYYLGRQFLNPAYAVPWRQIAEAIESRQQPSDLILSYFDSTPQRYGNFPNFIVGRPDFFPEALVPVQEWPRCGARLWLIARDRGSGEARRLQRETIEQLTPRASRVEVLSFMPYESIDRRIREAVLHRPVEEAYVKVYLFTPPEPTKRRGP